MIEFEWDNNKARENVRKHGVSFERRTMAKERSILLAMAGDRLLVVVHTERSNQGDVQRIRLISARHATRDEENYYYRENG